MMPLKSPVMSYNRIQVLHTLQPALVLNPMRNVVCITQFMDIPVLRTGKKHCLLIYETVRKRTEQINLLIRFSIACRAGVVLYSSGKAGERKKIVPRG